VRMFYALPLPHDTRLGIYEALGDARKRFPQLKWVSKDALHVTLFFIGEIDEEQLEVLKKRMVEREERQDFTKFLLSYSGLSTFPLRGKPRVLYTPVALGRDECIALHRAAVELSRGIVSPDRKKFIPHITLARVKDQKYPLKELYAVPLNGKETIDRMVLFQSVLGPKGPKYEERGNITFTDVSTG
jgi:RNA 2',3'-cyclic 3'-phosphodiesterase